MTPSSVITRQSITVTRDGEPLIMFSSHKSFEDVKDAIRAKDWELVYDLMDPAEHIVSSGGGRVSVLDGEVFVKDDSGEDFKVPTDLGDTIQLYLEENLPLEPVVNFAVKLNKNPSYRSVQQLFGFIKAILLLTRASARISRIVIVGRLIIPWVRRLRCLEIR
jgi:hypothetical protein